MAKSKGRYIIEFKDIPKERQQMPELPAKERVGNFDEVELGFDREQAVAEASRCLSCRRCLGCGLCLAECHTKAINFDDPDSDIELEIDSIIITPGAERIPATCELRFGYGKYINVVTSLEFERILSDAGPYGGLVLCPYDGEIPRRIAFVQRINHWGGEGGHRSLLYAMKEALIAQRKAGDLEAHIFFPDEEPLEDEFKKYFGRESKANLRKGKVLAIREIEENKNLVVQFAENGQMKEEEFDMVVLLTGLELPAEIKELGRKLGLELKSQSFWDTGDTSLAETPKSGIFLAGYEFID
jgi:heterodisulfide reductase subunit A-like polyferredoxin